MQIVPLTPAQEKLLKADDFKTIVTGWVMLAAALLVILSLSIVAWQCLRWIDTGVWPSRTWQDGFDWMGFGHPKTERVGLQRIADWFMGMGLWSLPFFGGLAGAWAWVAWADYETEELKEAKSMRAALKRQEH